MELLRNAWNYFGMHEILVECMKFLLTMFHKMFFVWAMLYYYIYCICLRKLEVHMASDFAVASQRGITVMSQRGDPQRKP